jgi:hypothetical protein
VKITRVESLVLTLPMVIDGATPMLGGRARTAIDMLLVRILGGDSSHQPRKGAP